MKAASVERFQGNQFLRGWELREKPVLQAGVGNDKRVERRDHVLQVLKDQEFLNIKVSYFEILFNQLIHLNIFRKYPNSRQDSTITKCLVKLIF